MALVTLTVLVGLPSLGTICAIACASPSAAAKSHHGAGQACEQAPSSPTNLTSAAAEDCSTHEDSVRPSPTTAAVRADVVATTAPVVIAEMNVPLDVPRDHGSLVDPTPPGPKPPKKKTPVLRV
jgi:hypothetical protein